MSVKVKVRCATDGIINLPKEIFNEIGWKINEEVEVVVCEVYIDRNNKYLAISVDREEDLKLLELSEEKETGVLKFDSMDEKV